MPEEEKVQVSIEVTDEATPKLEAMVGRIILAEQVDILKRLLALSIRELGGQHTGHWDPTMQSGAGCPVCSDERAFKEIVRGVLNRLEADVKDDLIDIREWIEEAQ